MKNEGSYLLEDEMVACIMKCNNTPYKPRNKANIAIVL